MNEEQRAFALESLKRMTANLPTKRELAWLEIQNGIDPLWVAHKYGFPAERMIAARAKLDAERAAKEKAA